MLPFTAGFINGYGELGRVQIWKCQYSSRNFSIQIQATYCYVNEVKSEKELLLINLKNESKLFRITYKQIITFKHC